MWSFKHKSYIKHKSTRRNLCAHWSMNYISNKSNVLLNFVSKQGQGMVSHILWHILSYSLIASIIKCRLIKSINNLITLKVTEYPISKASKLFQNRFQWYSLSSTCIYLWSNVENCLCESGVVFVFIFKLLNPCKFYMIIFYMIIFIQHVLL